MTPQNDNKSFLDRGTIIALALVMSFWMAWSWWMEKKYPKAATPKVVSSERQETESSAAPPSSLGAQNSGQDTGSERAVVGDVSGSAESIVRFEDESFSFEVSSKGMGLKNIHVRPFVTRDGKPIVLGSVQSQLPFATFSLEGNSPIDFIMSRPDARTIVGRASFGSTVVEKILKVNPSTYSVDIEIRATGISGGFSGFGTYLTDSTVDATQSSFLVPSFDVQDFTFLVDGSRKHEVISRDDTTDIQEQKNVRLAALSSHYFTIALADQSAVAPSFTAQIPAKASIASASLIHRMLVPGSEFVVKYKAYAGPKSLSVLESVDPELTTVINYGMFAWIAKPLLWLLKFLYSFIHNFGWSIIALTIIVRFLVLPFNVYSYRSMKVMQKLQPEMQRLREKYKDDPQTMNREVMELMKRNKANPLGGCLPMLLQLPIFLALYQVLGQSIELYRAPFIFWIQDLSVKDHFYVLPVLMGITMFVQQKITPTSMDPAQARILQWMPVIFTFFMVSLPSGLTLYIFVSTLFGIVQQYVFMREKAPEAKVSKARA